ncbi:MarR family winged helix-turn-helix transcriptional regulator [Desulfococcus sp.]|uniref:MarR family winged helix-turn-helix transcriptional regulator n=1 Tax=Desulfococcus sp. TaxID=2025834 RepID=UPI003593D2E8
MQAHDCIFFQLAKASQAGARHWNESVARFGVTAVQGMVLAFLAEEDDIPSGSLGSRVQLDSATLTGIVDRLARAGLVERRDSPDDRRAVRIRLTEKGRTVGRAVRGLIPAENRSFLSNLTDEEEMIFRTLLRKLLSRSG